MSKSYKNILKLRKKSYGDNRRMEISKTIANNSTPIPLPLEYEDIDKEFNKWVKEELYITFENEPLPTFALFSNQRFSEFLQSWDEVDEKKNLIMNFKTITRENNPKAGTINGNTRNIPGDYNILLKRVEATDKSGRHYFIDYKTKQPFSVDFIYTVGVVTNKYELINKFNQLMNEKFKAINCYISPNGHYIPMKLTDISDESEYNIDNRTYYSQNYTITVMAYIMPQDSFSVEEKPMLKFKGFEGEDEKSYAEIEEIPCHMTEDNTPKWELQKVNIKIFFNKCSFNYKFTLDTPFEIQNIKMENVRNINLYVNDNKTELKENIRFKNGDIIHFKNLTRFKTFESSEIVLEGINYENVVLK